MKLMHLVFVLILSGTLYSSFGNRTINADQVKRESVNQTATISLKKYEILSEDLPKILPEDLPDDSKRSNDYKVENSLRKKRLHLACQNFNRITRRIKNATLGKIN